MNTTVKIGSIPSTNVNLPPNLMSTVMVDVFSLSESYVHAINDPYGQPVFDVFGSPIVEVY